MSWFRKHIIQKYLIPKYKIGDKVIYDPFKLICKDNFNGYVVKIIYVDDEGLYTIECSNGAIITKIRDRDIENYTEN